jgi:hypothetical protein
MWSGYANLQIENQTHEANFVYFVKVALLDFSERTWVQRTSRSPEGEVPLLEQEQSDGKLLDLY